MTIDADGARLVSHNSIIRIGDEMPAAEATLIDPGAKRIESRLTRLARELRDEVTRSEVDDQPYGPK